MSSLKANNTAVYLSHPLSVGQPAYGGSPGTLEIAPLKAVRLGDSSHTFRVVLDNHAGTHVDAPAHFFENAATTVDYPPDFWIFRNPQVIDIAAKPAQLLDVALIDGKIKNTTDLLIIRTGFQSRRGQADYGTHNPGIHADVGFWLREHFPLVRAIGLDLVSLSSYQNRPAGRVAHKAFLDPEGKGNPIVIIEDMDLAKDLNGLTKVVVAPLLVEGIDSAPCTIIGFFD